MAARGNGRRVVVFGLDGATFSLIKPWALGGKLPNMRTVLERGVHGLLESTIPPVTPPAWTSSFTGVNPGKHGIFGFFKPMRNGYRRTPYNSTDIKVKRLWQVLDQYGKRSGVLHLPLTYPVDRFSGFLVSGIMTPDGARDFTHPPELQGELERAIPNYKLNIALNSWKAGHLEEFYRESVEIMQIEGQETLYLMDHKEWDLFYTMFHHVDGVMHVYWKFMDERNRFYPGDTPFKNAILNYYGELDEILGQILERLDDRTDLVILSDHGHEMIVKHVFLLNWLVDHGWLSVREKGAPVLKSALGQLGLQRERLVKQLRRWKLAWLPKLFPEALKDQVPRGVPTFKNLECNIAWDQTTAFLPSASGLGLWLNVRGREPQGVVERGEHYERLRDKLIKELEEFRDDESGEPVMESILKPESIYKGDQAKEAPDLLMLTRPGYYIHEGFGKSTLMYAGKRANERSGHHHLYGIFAACGKHVRRGVEIQDAHIIDIASTILYMMGLPVQTYMDGRVLTEIFEPKYVRSNPIEFGDVGTGSEVSPPVSYSEDEERLVSERLKDMGYM